MNLFMRAISFLISLVFKLFISLIAILFRLLAPIVLTILRSLRNLVFSSLVATVNGPTQYTNRLASEWTRHLIEIGASRDYIDEIYSLCRFLVMSRIVSGWIVAIVFTVAISSGCFRVLHLIR